MESPPGRRCKDRRRTWSSNSAPRPSLDEGKNKADAELKLLVPMPYCRGGLGERWSSMCAARLCTVSAKMAFTIRAFVFFVVLIFIGSNAVIESQFRLPLFPLFHSVQDCLLFLCRDLMLYEWKVKSTSKDSLGI